MIKETIPFLLNIPSEYTLGGQTNLYVLVFSWRVFNTRIETEFAEINTHLVIQVTNWMEVYLLAKERAKSQWMARDNARVISDLEVSKSGEIIINPLKN